MFGRKQQREQEDRNAARILSQWETAEREAIAVLGFLKTDASPHQKYVHSLYAAALCSKAGGRARIFLMNKTQAKHRHPMARVMDGAEVMLNVLGEFTEKAIGIGGQAFVEDVIQVRKGAFADQEKRDSQLFADCADARGLV